ncbi:YaaL family protein [Sporolactobacillus kofuensis]|uniref:YaaL family protein n=1 Tax=Sporolactobacillus kofuensis TaxID=269672 RepID=A0ABW1WL22_9BACL|nr:YaaL family protein [Sporolactobacillus kofuensis]MCO7177197.1 YaaL family protein [Sporolactobacillus kofuensis]
MFGRRKGLLRKEMTEQLLDLLERCKTEWMTKKRVIDASIDPSDEVLHQLKLAEARYFYLLKEVRELKQFMSR